MYPNVPNGVATRATEPAYQTALAVLKIERDEYRYAYGKYKEQKANIEKLKD